MSLHRRAARRDDNERSIIDALEAIGADVRQLSGARVPDLLVGFRGVTYLLGVKRPAGPKGGKSKWRDYHKGGAMSGDEKPDAWPGGLWVIVTTPAEAVAVLTSLRLVNAWHDGWDR